MDPTLLLTLIVSALLLTGTGVVSIVSFVFVRGLNEMREIRTGVQKVHEIVNSQRTAMEREIGELKKLLAASEWREAKRP